MMVVETRSSKQENMVTKALEWIAEGHGTFEIQMGYQITF
jgi:hypothetical protein